VGSESNGLKLVVRDRLSLPVFVVRTEELLPRLLSAEGSSGIGSSESNPIATLYQFVSAKYVPKGNIKTHMLI
jgi:hypothetical protein